VDFRKLNDLMVGDSFPLPNIQGIVDKLGRVQHFSATACASGYWQVPLAEEDGVKQLLAQPPAIMNNYGCYWV